MELRSSAALTISLARPLQPAWLGSLPNVDAPTELSREPRTPALVFTLEAGAEAWTVRGPDSLPRCVVSPLADERFRGLASSLREWACRPVPLGRHDPLQTIVFVEDRARRVSARLTKVLLSAEERRALGRALAAGGRARITLRARCGAGLGGEAALALPWELLAPEGPGRFPARDGRLLVVREAWTRDTAGPRDLPGAARHPAGTAHVMSSLGRAELDARLEERFDSILAAGGGIREALAAALAVLNEAAGGQGAKKHLPFGWTQLAVYHDG